MPTREEIEAIRERVNVVDVVSRYVSVQSRGENFLAICPFHPDKSPSLTINPEKGLFHCFGCGEGGDVFTFVMKIEGIEFPEAARRLADQAGIAVTRERGRSEALVALRELAHRVARYYGRCLGEAPGKQAGKYLADRGFAPGTIQRFRLGYAPPDGAHLMKALGDVKNLMQLGLVREGRAGRWSFFRDRLIFPVTSTQGDVIGFAGRALQEDPGGPKYLNTKNTPLFEKSRVLYGLAQAREGLRERGEALLVEGYTDVMMAHQHGFTHAVASMGTAFTAEQAGLLKRFASRALIAYDRDVAGRAATLRGMKKLLGAGLEVRVVLLPTGQDPDDLLRREGSDALAGVLEHAMPFPEFYVQALTEEHDTGSVSGQEEIIRAARDFLAGLGSPALRSRILKELSGSLDIPLEDLRMGMKERRQPVTMGFISPRKENWGVEEHLMHLLLQGELSLERAAEELDAADFDRFSHAMDVLFAFQREEGGSDRIEGKEGEKLLSEWLARLDPEDQQALRALAVSERRDADSEKAIAQLISRLRVAGVERRLSALKREIDEAEKHHDRPNVERLQREQQAQLKERQQLLQQLGWGASVSQGGGIRDG